LRAGPTGQIRVYWARAQFHFLVAWRARLLVTAGAALAAVSLIVMTLTISGELGLAVTAEVLLVVGALLVARGVRLWWQRRSRTTAAKPS
jgi:hypothetical protein